MVWLFGNTTFIVKEFEKFVLKNKVSRLSYPEKSTLISANISKKTYSTVFVVGNITFCNNLKLYICIYSNCVLFDKSINVIGAVFVPPLALISNFFRFTLFDKFRFAKTTFWSNTNSCNKVNVESGTVAN